MLVIAGFQLWLALLWFVYWGHGIARGLIVLVVMASLLLLRVIPPRPADEPEQRHIPRILRWAIALALLLNIILMIDTSQHALRTGKIPMDEGQTTWRAVRMLAHGENPYGTGALTDFVAFKKREVIREKIGMAPNVPVEARSGALANYDQTLDPALRKSLLPVPSSPTEVQRREASVIGYKYGPVILIATVLFEPFGISAAVLWLNAAACFGLFAVLWQIIRRIGASDMAVAAFAMLALLLDRHVTRDYISRSGTDVYSLFFGALAVLAYMKQRQTWTAIAVALSVGCKIFPGFGFFPLLFAFRSTRPVFIFAGVLMALYLPWMIWDAHGLFYNEFDWPLLMGSTRSSWQQSATAPLVFAARLLLLAGLAVVWIRFLLRRDDRLFWCLAMSNTLLLLAGATFSNNYVPWASIWIVISVVEAFAYVRQTGRAAPTTFAASPVSP